MKYALTGAAAAVLAFLLAPLLLPPVPPLPKPDPRFPLQTRSFSTRNRDAGRPGHAFSLEDRDESDPDDDPRWRRILAGRPKRRPAPASCLDCHASAADRRKPLGCPDCHDPATLALRLTRPWTPPPRAYNELRAALCAQCHRRYDIEWSHAETGARVLEPRHPQYELWSQGIHARSGVACPDCHMPALRRGALRLTEHRARTPLEMADAACARCHRAEAGELRARVRTIQDRTRALAARAAGALVAALDAIHDAQAAKADCRGALALETEAQWRLSYVANDRSTGFHAPQQSARLLAEAIDYARQAHLAAALALATAGSKSTGPRSAPAAHSRSPRPELSPPPAARGTPSSSPR
jgi:formate-dependent nitrite reductase cytochrome c552 subunit